MRTVWLWLCWLFSNSGAMRGSRGKSQVNSQTALMYTMGKHSLVKKKCPYCGTVYWAFTKGNKYCGQFACFKRMQGL